MSNYKSSQSRTFCAALSSICGGRVKVVCDGRSCTDGSTIYLPYPHQIASGDAQAVVYGIACHEAAHIYFDTPEHYQQFIASYTPQYKSLAALCYNAVADIADESRFEKRFELAKQYFSASTTHAAVSLMEHDNGDLMRPVIRVNSVEDVIVAAMLQTRRARIHDGSAEYAFKKVVGEDKLIQKSVGILHRALSRIRKRVRQRQRRDWNRLAGLAEQLLAVLNNSGLPSTNSSSQASAQGQASSSGGDQTNSEGKRSTSNDRIDSKNNCADEAAIDGLQNAQKPMDLTMDGSCGGDAMARITQRLIAEATDGQLGTPISDNPSCVRADILLAANPALKAMFRRHAKRLLQGPKPVVSMPSFSGSKLGDLSRWRIDGKVLLRRAIQPDVGTAVAIALDCSASMQSELAQVGTTASHLANALREAGGNIACWLYGDDVVGVPLRLSHRVRILGGTRTDLAIAAGRDWLSQQAEENRVLCVFTDGKPNRVSSCAAQVESCRRFGVKVLVGAVNCSAQQLRRSMPGAEFFEVGRNIEVGFHQAVRRIAQ